MRRLLPVLAATALGAALLVAPTHRNPRLAAPPAAAPARLTNLDHLDFLGDTRRTARPGPATRRTGWPQEPEIGTLWTYADRRDDGSYERVGGGAVRRRPPTPGARAPSTPTT